MSPPISPVSRIASWIRRVRSRIGTRISSLPDFTRTPIGRFQTMAIPPKENRADLATGTRLPPETAIGAPVLVCEANMEEV